MDKYKNGVDFVLVSYTKPEYAKQCIKSINLFFKNIPKNIYVVCNYLDKNEEMSNLENMLKQDDVTILEGIDQSSTTKVTTNSFQQTGVKTGKLDNNKTAMGSYYGAWGTNIGIEAGDRKYVCILDQDSIFLNECYEELTKLSDKYSFISNRWDPGTLFKEASDRKTELGMARPMMFFSKREFYDEIESEKYVENDVWSSSPFNVDWRDNGGNLTWYVQQKKKKFLVLPNSYWVESKRNRYKIDYDEIKMWHKSKDKHTLPLKEVDNEQCWIGEKPIHFHHGRGGYRGGINRIQEWINVTNNYFEGIENE
jgi:hypothetical protein